MNLELSATKFQKQSGVNLVIFFHFGVGAKIFDFCVVTACCIFVISMTECTSSCGRKKCCETRGVSGEGGVSGENWD